jgi:hypothetical protein
MINKDEMLTLLRSVAVPSDVEEGMGHAFDLGVDWERARVEKILRACEVDTAVVNDVLNGLVYV